MLLAKILHTLLPCGCPALAAVAAAALVKCALKTVVPTPASCSTDLIQQAIVTDILTSLRPALLCHSDLETFHQKVIIYMKTGTVPGP